MSSCSMINGHIDKITNYEKIKNMSFAETAQFIDDLHFNRKLCSNSRCEIYDSCKDCIKDWLNSESD